MFGGFFKNLGIILCTILWLGITWELAALLTGPGWPPTFSNMTQGLRDGGHEKLVAGIAFACGCLLMIFAQWLYFHFTHEARTGN